MRNSAGRIISVRFGPDPDVAIFSMGEGRTHPIVSVEVKGGRDVSNIHNRIGEAEKSHRKAKDQGFNEFWTILGAAVDQEVASRESPTTTRFFFLPAIESAQTPESAEFQEHLAIALGIPSPGVIGA